MKPTYHIFKNSITVHTEGKTLVISQDDKRYAMLYNAIHNNDLSVINSLPDSEAKESLKTLLLFSENDNNVDDNF